MVRTHYGPPRLKSRPYGDSEEMRPDEGNYSLHSKDRRNVQDYPVKPPLHWREHRGRGRSSAVRRVPLMGDQREPRFDHWKSHGQDSFQGYPHKMQPYHGQRRPSQHRFSRSPQAHHQSSHSPSRGHHSQRGRGFRGHPSGHVTSMSLPPRHFQTHPADRRPGSASPFRGSFRDPKRHTDYPLQDRRSRNLRGNRSLRGRPYEDSGHGMKRWNMAGSFSHPRNGEHGPPGPQRSHREMHGRGPFTERYRREAATPAGWSSEQDNRRHWGPVERLGSRSHSRERVQDDAHHSPYNTPSWKGAPGPASSYHSSPQERQVPGSRKRRITDVSMPSSTPPLEHGLIKHPRRDQPEMLRVPRPFGGKPLSPRDKSCTVKNQQMKAESLMRVRIPLSTKPRSHLMDNSAMLAIRKKRFQTGAPPLQSLEQRKEKQRSSSREKSDSSTSSGDSETEKDQVESRRSLGTHRSSPIEKRDLVVLSHWSAGPSSSQDCSPPKDHSPNPDSDESSDEDTSPSRQEKKSNESRSSPEEKKREHLDKKTFRPFNAMHDTYRFARPFRRPGPFQRPRMFFGPKRMNPELMTIRRPLMESLVPRPFPNQRPMFRKTHSIMSKYRNMRVMRQRAPYYRGSNQQRW